jgi:cell division protein FtsB
MQNFAILTVSAALAVTSAWWLGHSEAAFASPPSTSCEHGTGITAAQVNDLRRELESLRQQNQQLTRRLDAVLPAPGP